MRPENPSGGLWQGLEALEKQEAPWEGPEARWRYYFGRVGRA